MNGGEQEFQWLLFFLMAAIVIALAIGHAPAEAGEIHADVGVGYKLESMPWGKMDFQGDGPAAVIRLVYELDDGPTWKPHSIEYEHISHWFDGPPFNDNYEDHFDSINIMWRLW